MYAPSHLRQIFQWGFAFATFTRHWRQTTSLQCWQTILYARKRDTDFPHILQFSSSLLIFFYSSFCYVFQNRVDFIMPRFSVGASAMLKQDYHLLPFVKILKAF